MERKARKGFGAGLLAGIGATLLVLLAIGLAAAYGGLYDIAASSDHTAGMRWWLDTTMRQSIEARAPAPGTARAQGVDPAAGAGEYKAMCEHCHGGPGVAPAAWSRGMRPQPPELVDAAAEWRTEELYWIASHGIKYTGMPAFGHDHDEATLWNIAAFVAALPGMTPAQYAASAPAHDHGDGHGHHDDEGAATHGVGPRDDDAAAADIDGRPGDAGSTSGSQGGSATGSADRDRGQHQDGHDDHDHEH